MTTVGLLGTAFTMEQAFYRERLAAHGLTVLVPDRQDRAAVHAIIYHELCQGIVLDSELEPAAARTRRRLHPSQRVGCAAASDADPGGVR